MDIYNKLINMKEYVKRLIKEADDLAVKCEKLQAFAYDKSKLDKLSIEQQKLMWQQMSFMEGYYKILEKRIGIETGKDSKVLADKQTEDTENDVKFYWRNKYYSKPRIIRDFDELLRSWYANYGYKDVEFNHALQRANFFDLSDTFSKMLEADNYNTILCEYYSSDKKPRVVTFDNKVQDEEAVHRYKSEEKRKAKLKKRISRNVDNILAGLYTSDISETVNLDY